MNISPLWEDYNFDDFDVELEAMALDRSNREAELLMKRGYRIKKPVWSGLIAS